MMFLNPEVKVETVAEKTLTSYEVGTADKLLSRSVKGDGLDVHHVSQSKPAGQVIKGYDKTTAPAIALPKIEHTKIPTLKGTNTAGNARQQLAKDVKDLRKYTNAPNSSLQKVIVKFAQQHNFLISKWIAETISSRKELQERAFGSLLNKLKSGDILIISEISRMGRNLMQIMSILNQCMEKQVKVYAIKEGYELGDNINSKVLAFAFGLSAEIERTLISY